VKPEFEWVRLLDEVEEPKMPTVEAIEAMTAVDQLKEAAYIIETAPLTTVQRSSLRAAVEARASTLGVSTWDWTLYGNGAMLQVAVEVSQGMSDCTVGDDLGAVVALLDAAPGKPLRFRFKGSHANVISLNERAYLHQIIDPAVDRINARLAAGHVVLGEDLHPPMDVVDSTNPKRKWFRRTRSKAILKPERAFWQGDELLVDAQVIEDTEPGRQLAEDLRAGRRVLFSQRAYSGPQQVVPLADGRQVKIPLAMEIETWDRVPNPAIPDASVLSLLDSVQVQALCDAVQASAHAPAPAATKPIKGESAVKWNLALINALRGSKEGRAQILAALTDSTVTLEPEIRTAMTDALADVQAPTAATQTIDVQQAVTDALNKAAEESRQKAEAARQAREEAKTYVAGEIKTLRDSNRYPGALLDSIQTALADVPDKATAESQLKERLSMADSVMPAVHLANLGYGAPAGQAQALHIQVRENQAWKPMYDGLLKELDDYRASMPGGERPDLKLREANKSLVDQVLARFDARNAAALREAHTSWQRLTDSASAVTTADIWTQVLAQRAIIEQVFGDADMLQYVGTGVFNGVTQGMMVEYWEGSGSPGHHTGEMQAMARGKVKSAWISFSAFPRRINIEVSNDAQQALQGVLTYNAAARALFHGLNEVRRELNVELGNEMIRASDAYGAIPVVNETVAADELEAVDDAGNVGYVITLLKGGNADAPVVRPRPFAAFDHRGQATNLADHRITLKINNAEVPHRYLRVTDAGVAEIVSDSGALANGFAVDYETGLVYVSGNYTITPGVSDAVISYSYATNFTTFGIAVPIGWKRAEHYSELIHTIDDVAAMMGAHPRYRSPNIVLGSQKAMNPITQADMFYRDKSPNGTVLTPTNSFIANRNNVDFAKHNTRWQGGDRRILLGTARATQYAIRDPLAQKGPFPVYDSESNLLPGEQWYVEGFDALITPELVTQDGRILNPYYHSIILK
jgi:hypothetical protein